MGWNIRKARPEDAAALLKIYAPYVAETAVSFEYDVPTLDEFRRRICSTLERLPWLAAEDSEKLNLIAHSKGGLEARYCISTLGLADRVASLTTICTPHHGSKTAAAWQRRPLARMALAGAEDLYWSLRGDDQPDFRAVLEELTPAAMERFNQANPDSPQVYYQSWGARLEKRYHGEGGMARLLLALTGADGFTDGLVSPDSAVWGHWRGTLSCVSHLDAADSRGRDLPHFSVSDFYLRLVRELVEMGF